MTPTLIATVPTILRAVDTLELTHELILEQGSLADLLELLDSEHFTAAKSLVPSVRKSLRVAKDARAANLAVIREGLRPVETVGQDGAQGTAEVVTAVPDEVLYSIPS